MTPLLARWRACFPLAFALFLFGVAGQALAVTAGSGTILPTADCSSNANLSVDWTGAGNHYEYGAAYDSAGTLIGTFGPDTSANDDWNGQYLIPISTQQPPGSLIGAYAWVGANPPTPGTAIEYFVVYNCSARVVLYRCAGPFGSCANRVGQALASLPPVRHVPATSPTSLVALMLALGAAGTLMLRRKRVRA